MEKYTCASDSLRPGQLDRITAKLKDFNPIRRSEEQAEQFEEELNASISKYTKRGLKKADCIHKLKYVLKSVEMS